jgi:mono/diheme cytochrome c family protein
MKRHHVAILSLVLALTAASSVAVRAVGDAPGPTTTAERVARGEYLVRYGSCHDCHTPHKLGPKGPEPDMTRALSGHPSDLVLPAPPAMNGPWMWSGIGTFTAFAGPWGVSFTANLTPDKETGLGNWTEEMFLMALRTGRHEGKGRPILPPMPYQYVGSLSDEDLKAVFAYLQSIPPVRNKVPAPIDPPEEPKR